MKSQEENWLQDMMTPEQRRAVVEVYNHFLESEKRGWDMLDDYIVYLDFLDNDQLHREADVVYYQHGLGKVRCPQNHSRDKCLMPILLEAVGGILELYKENNSLHANNKYILQYYLAMNQSGMILVED